MPNRRDFTPLQFVLLVLGILGWIVAGFFGLNSTISTDARVDTTRAANLTAGGAALGFALAGGLCFVAAALCERGRDKGEGSRPPTA